MEISQDQLLGKGDYSNKERRAVYDGYTLALCHTALNVWDRIKEVGKKIESFTKVIQCSKKALMDLLQRLKSAVIASYQIQKLEK